MPKRLESHSSIDLPFYWNIRHNILNIYWKIIAWYYIDVSNLSSMNIYLKSATYFLFAFFVSCSGLSEKERQEKSSIENKSMLSKIYRMFETGDLTDLENYVHVSMIENTPDPNILPTGIEGLKELIQTNHIAFPDLKVKVYNMSAEGDLIYAHFNFSGTNTGPIRNNAPTMKSINIDGVDIVRIKDGKIAEHWGYWDTLKFINQLGKNNE